MKRILYCLLIGISVPFLALAQGFKIVGSELHDANGKNFIMKGVNVPLAWFVNDVNSNIATIRNRTNSNTFRIVVTTSTPDNAWQTCVQNCIKNKVIPMVELHDATGSNNTNDLLRMARWWASKASFFTKPEIARYILINIANEWSDWYTANTTSATWRDTYIASVKILRDAGIKTTLVVDGPGYGQDGAGKNILRNGLAIVNGDPLKNVLLSVHMYCQWKINGGSSISIDLPAIKKAGIPIIVGEFGYQHSEGNSICDIDESLILSTCQNNGIGWLAWSWKGNGSPVQFLDLSADWQGNNLSGWGKRIVDGQNGTKTAITASVFTITGTEDEAGIMDISVSPNPALDKINIVLPESSQPTTYHIFDCTGAIIKSGNLSSSNSEIEITDLSSGFYVISINNGKNVFSKKIIKK